jgi:cell division protein FtsB
MPIDTRRLVIRSHRPWLRPLLWGGLGVLMVAVVYLAFELGRLGAGHDSLAAWQQQRALQNTIEQLRRTNADLRAGLAELQTGQVSARHEREELARSIGELQGRIAQQNKDLAFYRGIVSDSAGANRVRVHQVTIAPGETAGGYRIRVVLVQTARPERDVSGTVTLSLEGAERGQPALLPLARLTADKREQLRFSFRYFQEFEQQVLLPADFTPAGVQVEVRAAGRTGEPLTEKFEWRVQESG